MAKDEQYRRGYAAGYVDGVRDSLQGHVKSAAELNIGKYPVMAMTISQRAINCLTNAGCVYISDVAELSEDTISTMRNMGKKTAREIACWLLDNGIRVSGWSKFL